MGLSDSDFITITFFLLVNWLPCSHFLFFSSPITSMFILVIFLSFCSLRIWYSFHPPTHMPSCLSSHPISCFFLSLKNKNKRKNPLKSMESDLCCPTVTSSPDMPGITPLRKTDFSSLGCYCLWIASWLGLGVSAHFTSVLGFRLPRARASLKHAFIVSVSSYVHLRRHACFLKITLHLCFYSPHLHRSSLYGRDMI